MHAYVRHDIIEGSSVLFEGYAIKMPFTDGYIGLLTGTNTLKMAALARFGMICCFTDV